MTPTSGWVLVVPGLLLILALLAAGCGERTSAPAASTALSVEEYAAWCGAGDAITNPAGGAEALADIWGVTPA